MLGRNNIITIIVILLVVTGMIYVNANSEVKAEVRDDKIVLDAENIDFEKLIEEKDLSTIYLAGGCFWGVEEYMSRIAGVYDAVSGYANGRTENPSYQDVLYKDTGHAETVKVIYDPEQVSLDELLVKFFKVVDPTSVNKQGNDVGTQYRSGVYYLNDTDKAVVDKALETLQGEYSKPIVVESLPLDNFYDAEEYHQDYLKKNINGYCHINLNLATEEEIVDAEDYPSVDIDEMKNTLTDLQFEVTQNNKTESAFSSDLNGNYEAGIYVDIVTGEPLFLSTDKYDSGTGWPSFTKPISSEVIVEDTANASLYFGTEVKSRAGLSHLGHVFTDGPKEAGGLRYCINGAALRFIPYNSMTSEGYGYLKHLIEDDENVTVVEP